MFKNTWIAGAASFALIGASFAGGEGWTSDYASACKQAAAENKDLLIDFTGSDWCGWCKRLDKEVFQEPAFKTGVKDKFVLVEIDFPEDDSKLSEETKKQNESLGEKYAVEGYPTIMLCDATGRPYAQTGYQEGGAEKYLAHLDELRAKKASRDKALAEADKAEGLAKANGLIQALDGMELNPKLVDNFYRDFADKIIAADPKDETGYKKKAEAKGKLEKLEASIQETAQMGDMDGVLKLIDDAVADGGFDDETTLQLMVTRGLVMAQKGDFDGAIKAVDEAAAKFPKNEHAEEIAQLRAQLATEKENRAKAKEAAEDDSDKAEKPKDDAASPQAPQAAPAENAPAGKE